MDFRIDDKTLSILKNNYSYFYNHLDDFYYMHNSYKERTVELKNPYKGSNKIITPEETINLARSVLEEINPKYIDNYDDLVNRNKILIDEKFDGSRCNGDDYNDITTWRIEIEDKKDYDNVITLIHEFFHYSNKLTGDSKCRKFFGEFISIYFEMKAVDILLSKGVSKEELNCEWRLFATRDQLTLASEEGNEYFDKNNEMYPRRVYAYFVHLLGQFLAEYAIKNNISLDTMIFINDNINNYDNYDDVFNALGTNDYKKITDIALDAICDRLKNKEKVR